MKSQTSKRNTHKMMKERKKKLAAGALLSDEAADGKASQLQWNYL